ncbi:MAG: 2-C-methyl-D-erythritol 2,4-cyclodiphosphate synthase [Flavobacteriales bacterium]|nr:2-C-methyl-D-erythritol 2,4-cyclodiphosphate synthase [Flavobacteriales bacterium]
MDFRIGFGYDVHRLVEGRALWLGGVEVASDKGALGHSDADVLLHAICDAILGAAGLRDIGFHFPDTGTTWKDADSKILLRRSMELIREAGWEVGNIDCTLLLERPKIAPYRDAMIAAIGKSAGIESHQISIKATTSEGMGFVGDGEGVAAYAVALIRRAQ